MRLSDFGIACESGGFRCVFVHGALDALEEHEIRAAVYAAASASVMPAAFAAAGRARNPGVGYWNDAFTVRFAEGNGMSEMVLAGIEKYAPHVESMLFESDAPRFVIAASEVVDQATAADTQGSLASRTGREQLLRMSRGDDTWAAANLRSVMFDTKHDADDSNGESERLTREKFRSLAYASTRMLHAWRVPAFVGSRPFIDASYTDGFPARVLASLGMKTILAIATTVGDAYVNLYRRNRLVDVVGSASIEFIAPQVELKELGVDFTTATAEGIQRVYDHGREVALGWVASRGGTV